MVVIHEPTPGASAARNAGLRVARGEFVLFTDDDAVVHDGWIDSLLRAFEAEVGAVGGRVLPKILGPRPQWLGDFAGVPLTLWDYGPEPFEMGGSALPLGVNMGVRRQVIAHMEEPFDTRLGHRGGASIGYEETHLVRRIGMRSRVVYVPAAVVEHVIDVNRLTYASVRRSFFQSGFGRARHERLAGTRDERPFAQRCRGAALAYGVALASTWRGMPGGQRSSTVARKEFLAYLHAGQQLERLFAATPRLADWCARRLAL